MPCEVTNQIQIGVSPKKSSGSQLIRKVCVHKPSMAHGQSRKSLVSRKYPSSKHTDEWAFTKNKGRAAWPYTDTLSRKLEHIIISATS